MFDGWRSLRIARKVGATLAPELDDIITRSGLAVGCLATHTVLLGYLCIRIEAVTRQIMRYAGSPSLHGLVLVDVMKQLLGRETPVPERLASLLANDPADVDFAAGAAAAFRRPMGCDGSSTVVELLKFLELPGVEPV